MLRKSERKKNKSGERIKKNKRNEKQRRKIILQLSHNSCYILCIKFNCKCSNYYGTDKYKEKMAEINLKSPRGHLPKAWNKTQKYLMRINSPKSVAIAKVKKPNLPYS